MKKLFSVVKLPLSQNSIGYNDPAKWSTHKELTTEQILAGETSDVLGVVGKNFEILQPEMFLRSISLTLIQNSIDISGMTFSEYYSGAKICFEVMVKEVDKETGSSYWLVFITGYDGLTKNQIRLVERKGVTCRTIQNIKVKTSFKNTKSSQGKLLVFSADLSKVDLVIDEAKQFYKELKNKQIDNFVMKEMIRNILNVSEDHESTRGRNLYDSVMAYIRTEIGVTGNNMYSVQEGIAMYLWESQNKIGDMLFGEKSKMFDRLQEKMKDYLILQ